MGEGDINQMPELIQEHQEYQQEVLEQLGDLTAGLDNHNTSACQRCFEEALAQCGVPIDKFAELEQDSQIAEAGMCDICNKDQEGFLFTLESAFAELDIKPNNVLEMT